MSRMDGHRIVQGGCVKPDPPAPPPPAPGLLSAVVAFLIRIAKQWSAPGSGPKLTSV
jgi:hypothetical protein